MGQATDGETDKPLGRKVTVLLLVGAALLSYTIMADFDVRLATAHADDSPLVYSHVFANPDSWKNDVVGTHGKWALWATAINWVPAILTQYIGVSARGICWGIVFLQNFLVLIAVFRLAFVCTRDRQASVLTSLFVFSAQLWGFNLANYAANMPLHWAIGSFFSLPLVLLAMASFLRGGLLGSFLSFAIAGLIHPVMTLYGVLILGIFSLFEYPHESRRVFWVRVAVLFTIACICGGPQLLNLMTLDGAGGIEPADFIGAIETNIHIFPWRSAPLWARLWPNFLAYSLLAAITFIVGRSSLLKPYQRLLIATSLACVLMACAEFVGIGLEIPILLKLYPLRISMFLALVAAPMVVKWSLDCATSSNSALRWVPASMLALMAAYSQGIFIPLWFALLMYLLLPENAKGQHVVNAVVTVCIAVLIVRPDLRSVLVPTLYLPHGLKLRIVIPLVIFGLMLVAYRYRREKLSVLRSERVFVVAGILLFCFGLAKSRHAYLQLRGGVQPSIHAAQIWANSNTLADAVFITQSPWRGYSERRAIVPAVGGWWVYSGDKTLKNFDDRLVRFWGLEDRGKERGAAAVSQSVRASFASMTTEDALRFAGEFGGTHIVRLEGMTKLDFPVVFKAPKITIYEIPQS
jgi:hypothetical protein